MGTHRIQTMLRRLIKTKVASALHWTRMDNLFGVYCGISTMPLVISYHRVVENFSDSAARSISPMLVSVKTLERQLDWIGKKYDFVSLDDLAICQERNIRLRKPVAAITFDDGYQDVYEYGFPVLKRKGIPSAIFVVTDNVDTAEIHMHDQLYRNISRALSGVSSRKELIEAIGKLDLPPRVFNLLLKNIDNPYRFTRLCLEHFCQHDLRRISAALKNITEHIDTLSSEFQSVTWDMLRKMSANDVTVGSHTRSHALLVNETPERVFDEVNESRLTTEKMLGVPVRHFAYPDGRFNREVLKAVSNAGYQCAYTTCFHRDKDFPHLTIPRRVMWEYSGTDAFYKFSPAMMSCLVNGVFDLASKCSQIHGPLAGANHQ